MSTIDTAFSQTYAEARAKFLKAVVGAGLDVHTYGLPLRGRDGEELAVDVARFGDEDATRLLVVSSGCHGVEGFCGSGVQVTMLRDPSWHAAASAHRVAVLYVHALNPWGFSWWRRTTQENVDLNRNFVDFPLPLPVNKGYLELHPALVPTTWPPMPEAERVISDFVTRHGMRALQTAVSGGQHDEPQGLCFAGHGPCWSHDTWRRVLRDHGQRCARLAWIDLHTGLGPTGHGERIFFCRDDAQALARARTWWGDAVTSIYDGSSVSTRLSGMAFEAIYQECPQAQYTGIAIEYGTQPMFEVLHALRADQWQQNHPEAPDELRHAIKRQVRDAFYTDTIEWKSRVVEQAQHAARQAVAGLAAG